MPDSVRKIQVRRENVPTAPPSPVTATITHAKMSTTVVRTAVARFELTPVTPSFASTAVAAANTADNKDQASQEFLIGSTLIAMIEAREAKRQPAQLGRGRARTLRSHRELFAVSSVSTKLSAL